LEKKVLILSSKKAVNLSSDIDVLLMLDFQKQNAENFLKIFPEELRQMTTGEFREWAE
jgi:hypothetical protein